MEKVDSKLLNIDMESWGFESVLLIQERNNLAHGVSFSTTHSSQIDFEWTNLKQEKKNIEGSIRKLFTIINHTSAEDLNYVFGGFIDKVYRGIVNEDKEKKKKREYSLKNLIFRWGHQFEEIFTNPSETFSTTIKSVHEKYTDLIFKNRIINECLTLPENSKYPFGYFLADSYNNNEVDLDLDDDKLERKQLSTCIIEAYSLLKKKLRYINKRLGYLKSKKNYSYKFIFDLKKYFHCFFSKTFKTLDDEEHLITKNLISSFKKIFGYIKILNENRHERETRRRKYIEWISRKIRSSYPFKQKLSLPGGYRNFNFS
jgi:hypothetical protein